MILEIIIIIIIMINLFLTIRQKNGQTNKILYNVKPCYVSTKNDIVLVNPSSYMLATVFFQTISFSHFVEFLMEQKISTLAFDHNVYII